MAKNKELDDDKEKKESNYFHECRKDVNCDCHMCLASIKATLDLMPTSAQRSSLTKLSASKRYANKTPVSIDPTLLLTPTSRTSFPATVVASSKPVLQSTAKTRVLRGKGSKSGFCLLVVILIVGVVFGFYWGALRVLQPRLSDDIVRDLVQEFSDVENLSERLKLIQKRLNYTVDGKVSSCDLEDSNWTIYQDGLIFLSNCKLYKSAAEEVFLRGWPPQTSGIVAAGFSPRFFNVLYGNITECPEEKNMCVVREANTTWILPKFSTSVVQFEQKSLIIEYRSSSLLEIVMEFVTKIFVDRTKQHTWLLPKFWYCTASTLETTGPMQWRILDSSTGRSCYSKQ